MMPGWHQKRSRPDLPGFGSAATPAGQCACTCAASAVKIFAGSCAITSHRFLRQNRPEHAALVILCPTAPKLDDPAPPAQTVAAPKSERLGRLHIEMSINQDRWFIGPGMQPMPAHHRMPLRWQHLCPLNARASIAPRPTLPPAPHPGYSRAWLTPRVSAQTPVIPTQITLVPHPDTADKPSLSPAIAPRGQTVSNRQANARPVRVFL